MSELTPERLNEIKARAEAATPEPLARSLYDHGGGRMYVDGDAGKRQLVLDAYTEADRDFYFAARTDIPDLLAALDAARAEIARLREALAQYADRSNWGDRRDKTGRVIEDEWIGNEMNGYVVAETALASAPAPS